MAAFISRAQLTSTSPFVHVLPAYKQSITGGQDLIFHGRYLHQYISRWRQGDWGFQWQEAWGFFFYYSLLTQNHFVHWQNSQVENNNNFKFKIYSKNNHACKCGYMLVLESSNSVRCSRHRGSQRITRYLFSIRFKGTIKEMAPVSELIIVQYSGWLYTKACTMTWGDPILYQVEGSKLGKKTICELKMCTSGLSCDWQNSFQAFFWRETVLCPVLPWNGTHFFLYVVEIKPQGHHLMTYYLSARTCIFARMNEAFVVGLM